VSGQATVRTTPDLLRNDGTTAGIITSPDGTTLEVVSIPGDEDRGRWDAGADLALRAAGWARLGGWAYDDGTGELVAPVGRLVTIGLRDGGPIAQVVDVAGAVRDEYGEDAFLSGGHDVGGMREYDVLRPSDQRDVWHRLGSCYLYDD